MSERHTSGDKTGNRLTKRRQFLRRLIVGGGTVTLVAGDYIRPELETLLGPQVAAAHGSGHRWGPGGRRGR